MSNYTPWWAEDLTEEEGRLFPEKHYDRLPGATLPEGIVVEKDVPVETSDGLRLAANVFRPDADGEFPVLLAFTPFSKDYYGQHAAFGVSEKTPFEAPDPGFWVPHDYVMVHIDRRGTGRSPSGGTGRAYDYRDAVEWAGTRPWSTGKVGLGPGHSAISDFQWEVASMENPPSHLEAIMPWGGFLWERGSSRPGGVPQAKFRPSFGENLPLWQADFEPEERPALPAFERTPEVIRNVTVPTLLGSAWADTAHHLRGNLFAWRTISTPYEDKWLYTYGGRKWKGMYTPAETREVQLKFFDRYLKGVESGIQEVQHVRLEVRDTLFDSEVRFEDDWPIERTEYTKLYLDSRDGSLDYRKPSEESTVSYDSETSEGKASFEFTFEEGTEISGHSKLVLWATPEDANDMDLFVTLRKFDARGHEVRFKADTAPGRWPVDQGWLRLSKRELDEERSEPWLPVQRSVTAGEPQRKVEPGEIVSAHVQIVGSSTSFRSGEMLRVDISGKHGVENDIVFAYDDLNEGRHSILTGGEYGSYLQIPVIPAKGGTR